MNNKVDLCESAASGGEIAISAKQGVGLSELKARLLEVVAWRRRRTGLALLCSTRRAKSGFSFQSAARAARAATTPAL